MASHATDGADGAVGIAPDERAERLADLVIALADENANLQRALDTRIVIEQAKGVLAERFDVDVHEAFRLLRFAARSNRIRLYDLAALEVRVYVGRGELEELQDHEREAVDREDAGRPTAPAAPTGVLEAAQAREDRRRPDHDRDAPDPGRRVLARAQERAWRRLLAERPPGREGEVA